MKRIVSFTALVLLAVSPVALTAKPIEESDVKSGKAQLDPAMGYIFVSGATRQSGVFLRVPDEATHRAYDVDRQKALAKAQKRYASDLQQWEADVQAAEQIKQAPPDKPEPPTLETVSMDPIELRDSESFGPFFVFAKGDTYSYLNSVKPGTWIYYGPLITGANGGAAGSCYCLGSVRFEVKPGVVTDLGTSLSNAPQWDSEMDVGRLQLKAVNAKRVAEGKEPLPFAKGPVIYGLPSSIASWPSVKAELHANAKMNNYYGATVTRMAPIPGVLAYHRDVVVDERTGQELASPTFVTRAKIKQ